MKKILIIIAAFFLTPTFSQDTISAVRKNFLSISADDFVGRDDFGFVYYIKDNVLFKEKDGKSMDYKNLGLGRIKRVDLQNPLKILIFYEDFNTVVTVDNQLNETQKINFSALDASPVITAAGTASQNRFWIYNSLTQQIGLFDYLKNTYLFIAPPVTGTIATYTSDFNYFQWIDAYGKWYSCDLFGKVQSLGSVPKNDKLCFIGSEGLIYAADAKLYFFSIKNDKKYYIENIDKSFQTFFFKDQILSIFTNRGITNYKITLP
ncbi:hypothetical protein [Flavobacterium sp.]|uniref:hypothetical protein n=1 Tax=Flavobacterium sp. TaxID=239 RepID=UPI00261E0124|nr:hypothetical protein [Flavobacterium sp.]